MMRNRHQKGYLYRKGGSWFVRFYDSVLQDGLVKRVQVSRKIASVSEFRTKADVRPLVEEFLAPFNNGQVTVSGTMTLKSFVETVYLPYVKEQLRPSTYAGYRDLWNRHLDARCGEFRLRDFRTWDGELLLQNIARTSNLGRTSMKHVKALLSGIFKHAKRQGVLNGINPMQDVSIPRAKEAEDTYAYSLEEIGKMLSILSEPAATVVAAAAFTGARRGELRGFLWENYDGKVISISQSVWRGHITEPKTRKSKSPVPVIAPLAQFLHGHRQACGNPTTGLIFASGRGMPLDLAHLARHVIRPALKSAGVPWHGWHAFRRGLATNLYRMGIADKTIQAILRHANISTTMNSYVKSVPADTANAMKAFEVLCTNHATAASPSVNRPALAVQ